jgi:sugar O-acyltransferase (sialic acid O-acetyltransferase NeuD family)
MLIAGAGGFALQLFDTLADLKIIDEIIFFDDTPGSRNNTFYDKFPVIHSMDQVSEHFKKDNRFLLGTGNPATRRMFFEKFSSFGGDPTTVISPFASVGKFNVHIGKGATILRNAIIESNVTIGEGCLINLNATITHGTKLGDFCELCPGVNISGEVLVGELCFLGTGCIILPKIKLDKNCKIAAGAVVTKNVAEGVTVAGIPASKK